MSLYDSFDYMTKQRNIIWVGPTGTGKTGLASGFLLHAIERGYRGKYVLFSDLVMELFQCTSRIRGPGTARAPRPG